MPQSYLVYLPIGSLFKSGKILSGDKIDKI